MSLEDKINNAKLTTWPTEGLSKIKVRFIVITTKLKRRILRRINR